MVRHHTDHHTTLCSPCFLRKAGLLLFVCPHWGGHSFPRHEDPTATATAIATTAETKRIENHLLACCAERGRRLVGGGTEAMESRERQVCQMMVSQLRGSLKLRTNRCNVMNDRARRGQCHGIRPVWACVEGKSYLLTGYCSRKGQERKAMKQVKTRQDKTQTRTSSMPGWLIT